MNADIQSPLQQFEDRRLARRVRLTLANLHLPTLRSLAVEATGGKVTLRGRLSSFHQKQLAQHWARRVPGVFEVHDLIQVIDPPRNGRDIRGRNAAWRLPLEWIASPQGESAA
jgi:osmotically-inducible protein OsmY